MKPIKNTSSGDSVPVGSVWKPVPGGGCFAWKKGNVRVTAVVGEQIYYYYDKPGGLTHDFSQHIRPFTFYSRRVIE